MLCGLRLWLGRQSPIFAGVVSYGLVLSVTLACTILGQFFLSRRLPDLWVVIDNLVLAAIFGGIVLRYLYIQQQLHNQQQAELRARIQALQSRIRPHFLFNSLNSIASLVATDADTAERMIEDLASLFRASLQEPGLISLSEELELCRQYVAIEQRRLGDRLQVNWQISEELEPQLTDIRFPSLLLQPLLENAIHHGIQPRPEGGEVWLQLQIEDGYLRINMTNPVMQELPGLLVSGHSGNQMALDNIHYRLQAYYNGQAELKMHKNVDIFEVTLTIPI
jgi:two-component system sensor histidine kinase AlgZ